MKRVIIAVILAALAATFAVPALAGAAEDTFIITYWFGPLNTDAGYAEAAEANFTVAGPVLVPPTVEENLKYMDLAQKHGMKYIVNDARVMAKAPGTPGFEEALDAVVADYSKHPALYGYYLKDEPGPWDFPLLAGITQYLLKKDPAHVPYVNIYPTYVDPAGIGGATYEQHVEQYLSTVKPALLAYDHYALKGGYERPDYFQNLEIAREAAIKHGIPWMSSILVTPHYDYRDPNLADLRWQAYTNAAYGGRGIGYYTYWTPAEAELGYRNGIVDTKGKRTAHYDMVKTVNGELKALAPTLLKLKSTAVYNTGALPIGTKPLPADAIVKSVSGPGMVVGLFEGPDKTDWLMLANRDPRNPARVTVRLSEPRKISEVDKTSGKLKHLAISPQANPTIHSFDFEAGEGRLFLLAR